MKKHFKKITGLVFSSLLITVLHTQSKPEGTAINATYAADFTGYEALDPMIVNKRLVMTGENHTFAGFNSRIELKMLRYLNEKQGFRNLIIELGSARAYYMNRYISTGDSMAKKCLEATTGKKYMDMLKRLKKWNMSLPDSMRITVHGIDVERFNDLPMLRLAELLPDSAIPAGLVTFCGGVKMTSEAILTDRYRQSRSGLWNTSWGWSVNDDIKGWPTVNEVVRQFDSLKTEIKNWLNPQQFKLTEQCVGWLREYIKWENLENSYAQYMWREENIYRNLTRLMDENKTAKFFGQFGRCHIAYREQNGDCGWYGYHSTMSKVVDRYKGAPDGVLAIGIFYKDRLTNFPENSSFLAEYDSFKNEVQEFMTATPFGEVHLYNLNKQMNPPKNLGSRYGMVIINNHFKIDSDDEDGKDDSDTAVNEYKDLPSPKVRVYGGMGYYSADNLTKVKNFYNSNGNSTAMSINNFNMYQLGWEAEDGKKTYGYNYTWMPSVVIGNYKNRSHTFTQRIYAFKYQYSVLKKGTNNLGPYLNIGYGRQVLRAADTTVPFDINQDTKRSVKYVNHSLATTLGISANKNLFHDALYIGLDAGYTFDFSKTDWVNKGRFVSANLKARQQYYFAMVKLGIVFDAD